MPSEAPTSQSADPNNPRPTRKLGRVLSSDALHEVFIFPTQLALRIQCSKRLPQYPRLAQEVSFSKSKPWFKVSAHSSKPVRTCPCRIPGSSWLSRCASTAGLCSLCGRTRGPAELPLLGGMGFHGAAFIPTTSAPVIIPNNSDLRYSMLPCIPKTRTSSLITCSSSSGSVTLIRSHGASTGFPCGHPITMILLMIEIPHHFNIPKYTKTLGSMVV